MMYVCDDNIFSTSYEKLMIIFLNLRSIHCLYQPHLISLYIGWNLIRIFLCQIYPDGIRHIRSDKRVNEWKTPGKKSIVKCAVNQRQVVIALTGGELVYFEMDPVRIR